MEEWEAAFYAYRAAQARTSSAGAYLALYEWEATVQALSIAASSAEWVKYVVKVTRALRGRQLILARSYMQYIRALEIQEPLGEPINGGDPTRLSTYRDAFLDELQNAAQIGDNEPRTSDADWEFIESEARMADPSEASTNARAADFRKIDLDRHIQEFLDTWGADTEVTPEEYNWPEPEGELNDKAHEQFYLRVVDEAEKAISEAQKDRGKVEQAADSEIRESPQERDQRVREQAVADYKTQGNRAAGKVMAATNDAADQVMKWAMQTDRKIRAVARGTGPNPCWMCAAAAARGWAYSSVASAMTTRGGTGGDVDSRFKKFHENCQCFPIVRYVDASELPYLSQLWAGMWKDADEQDGNTRNNFQRALYARHKDEINEKRRRRYWDRKTHDEWAAAGRS